MTTGSLTLPRLIAERAKTLDTDFLIHVDGTRQSWSDVDQRARDWADALERQGVGPGDRVAVMLPPSLEAMAVWLGIAWLRAVEVPLHTAYRGKMLEYTVNHVSPTALVVDQEFIPRIVEIAEALSGDLRIIRLGAESGATGSDGEGLGTRIREAGDILIRGVERTFKGPEPHDLACILYTSGTTGPSKGVMVPWAQLCSMSEACVPIEGLSSKDVWYSPYPTFHASGKIPLYAMALVGGSVVVRERFSTSAFWDDVCGFGVTTTMMIGASAGLIVDQHGARGLHRTPLRHALVSPPPADPQEFEKSLGIRICSVFNMTEISAPISTGWRQMTDRTCGQVRPGYEARIVDEFDHELPRGVPGELIVRSSQPWMLNVGYWNMPQQTAEAWRNGWFHTGDVCVQNERGEFYFVDRLKDAIRRRGENISSMEIEVSVIEHPRVLECAAFGVEADQGEEEVKIAVVVTGPETFDPAELHAYLVSKLPRFMVPRYIEVLPALPRTPREKVKKKELRSLGVTPTSWDRERS